ncbi:hypothetical protein CTAYLR_000016 [Chrysophaeum taylorii]|uniref:Sulfotransferase domain-containing protein n=1 Tax=Chrysophaeum taylorii TaxID=2483200 RepID=A0AAD7UGF9_9STRA|nr:hypothetical protein CTAYLR_000016 [Chrysophaeum taylorii]
MRRRVGSAAAAPEADDHPQAKLKKRRQRQASAMPFVMVGVMLVIAWKVYGIARVHGIERESPAPTDVLLVSFPKSGSNWVRFLLCGLKKKKVGAADKLSFPFVERAVPDLEYGPNRFRFRKGSRIAWKSHQPYLPNPKGAAEKPERCPLLNMESFQCLCPNCPARWRKIVYLVRDGRSVLCSYYRMQTQLGNFVGTFEGFLKSHKSKYGYAWPDHVASYFDNHDVHLLKYEDLIRHPLDTLREIAAWVGASDTSDDTLAALLDAASIDNMRATEKRDGTPLFDVHFPDARDKGGFKLVGTGEIDGWRHCTDDTSLFETHVPGFNDIMANLGYDD